MGDILTLSTAEKDPSRIAAVVRQLAERESSRGNSIELNLLDYIPLALRPSVLDFSITTDVTSYVQAAVNAAAGRVIRAPVGRYPLYSGASYSGPINLIGDGHGCGPGPAAIANSGCTQFMVYFSSGDVFSSTSNAPSTFRDFQINTIPASRPRTSGAGIAISGPSGSPGSTNANSKVLNVGMTNQYDCVKFVRPSFPTVRGCYFDSWVHAGVVASTTASIEGSAGFIDGNYFFGTSGSTSQDSCVLLSCGYASVSRNLLLGAAYGVHISIDTFDAGAIRIFDNWIENQGIEGIHAGSGDGHTSSMLSIVRNEFSNVAFTTNWTASITILDYSSGTDWISDIEIAHNVHRHSLSVNHRFIWIQSGKTLAIRDEQLENLGAGASTIGIDLSTFVTAALKAPVTVSGIQYQGTFGSGKILTASTVVAAERALQKQVFTSSGTFTTPDTALRSTVFKVTVTGGGGGGGGGSTNNVTGPGGSGGATAVKWYTSLVAGTGYTVTVGAGGNGGAAAADGVDGNDSSFAGPGTTITGGKGLKGIISGVKGSAGGTATSGDINLSGGAAGNGTIGTAPWQSGGFGGGTMWGSGGAAGIASTTANAGSAGLAYGTGGGGGNATPTNQGAGGNGAGGIVTVEWIL